MQSQQKGAIKLLFVMQQKINNHEDRNLLTQIWTYVTACVLLVYCSLALQKGDTYLSKYMHVVINLDKVNHDILIYS